MDHKRLSNQISNSSQYSAYSTSTNKSNVRKRHSSQPQAGGGINGALGAPGFGSHLSMRSQLTSTQSESAQSKEELQMSYSRHYVCLSAY